MPFHIAFRLVLAALLALSAPGTADRAGAAEAQREITIFAAASLGPSLGKVAKAFEAETGVRAVLSLAGSSALARQIEAGAPADLFLSANGAWMDHLVAKGLIAAGTRADILGNRLVLIAHGPQAEAEEERGSDIARLIEGKRIATALTEAVPLGIYAKAALEALGLWDAARPHLVQADNARAALILVARGAVGMGIVYATDATGEDRVRVIAEIPETTHPSITYPIAAIKGRDGADARRFLTFVQGRKARAIFAEAGFTLPKPLPKPLP